MSPSLQVTLIRQSHQEKIEKLDNMSEMLHREEPSQSDLSEGTNRTRETS